ncbi:hypothetical protein E2C01_060715 [Portunus trituberculatus]|uniref:Uncharacterized protein n=1 Tax=Portunus trituberculatus TaxID=210409 RepID=A0A5B7H9G5_PORTR|nr:hypothetical protein [Portunus trituberculatus]
MYFTHDASVFPACVWFGASLQRPFSGGLSTSGHNYNYAPGSCLPLDHQPCSVCLASIFYNSTFRVFVLGCFSPLNKATQHIGGSATCYPSASQVLPRFAATLLLQASVPMACSTLFLLVWCLLRHVFLLPLALCSCWLLLQLPLQYADTCTCYCFVPAFALSLSATDILFLPCGLQSSLRLPSCLVPATSPHALLSSYLLSSSSKVSQEAVSSGVSGHRSVPQVEQLQSLTSLFCIFPLFFFSFCKLCIQPLFKQETPSCLHGLCPQL